MKPVKHSNDRITRRKALAIFLPTISASFLISQPSSAIDTLFKPNPLTNPILEKFRIWDQEDVNNIRYSGELAPGSPRENESYAKMLVPILQIQEDILTLDHLIHQPNGEGLGDADVILSKPYFQKVRFKKIFNNFGDNIYYSDPDRANIYLGGGAAPQNEQTISYLLRNEILTNVENLQAEVTYLKKEQQLLHSLDVEDSYFYIKASKDAFQKYLQSIPPDILSKSKAISLQ